jgi:peptide/nickel transport system substrate-binding protein
MRKGPRGSATVIGAISLALLAAACGSSGQTPTAAGPTGVVTGGLGLTRPTNPSGAKVPGGTVYFTEGPQATPNYIFPMYSFAYCSTTNNNQFMFMMYRPLYWYGNNYRPTVDYDYSIGQTPVFSNGNKTVTIKLNPWKWSNGETVTSRDLVLWMNVLKADPATEWCGYAPGYFPDLVTSYSAPDPQTFVMNFNKAYNPEWVLYNVLSQLTPMPLAWDRTALSQPAPTSDNGDLPDTTKAGATAVYKFLDAQSKNLGSWPSSPIWQVVDGPFKLKSYTTSGEATLVPNSAYSGSPKPRISALVELPFTSEAAIFNTERSGGPSAITVGNVPAQYAPQLPALASQGYEVNKAASYSFNYFPLNFNSSAATSPGNEPVRYVFRQPYFREAFQHLIDQPGWITAYLSNTASPTCGPIPLAPPSSLVSSSAVSLGPCSYSVSAGKQLLGANGWKVVPNGTTTCQKPGTAAGDCGAGINAGEGISFTIDYESGVVNVENEMNDLAANAKKLGINIGLTTHPFNNVVATAVPCTPDQSRCRWSAEYWGAGWIYGPDYLPTGEPLYNPGAAANAGSYSDSKMTQLITSTITAPASSESRDLSAYSQYASTQVPVVFTPTPLGTYGGDAAVAVDGKLGGYAANALGLMNPEDWYFTK